MSQDEFELKRRHLENIFLDLELIKNDPKIIDDSCSEIIRKVDLKREELKLKILIDIDKYYDYLLNRIDAEKETCYKNINNFTRIDDLQSNNIADIENRFYSLNKWLDDFQHLKDNLNISDKFELIEPDIVFNSRKHFGILRKKLDNIIFDNNCKDLFDHDSFILCIKEGINGEIISSSFDQTIKVWDISSLKCVCTLKGHTGSVTTVQVLNNFEIISGSRDRTIKIWDLRNGGECIKTLHGHEDDVWSLKILNNSEVISGSSDKTIRKWDKETGECKLILRGHLKCVNCVDLINNYEFVSSSIDGVIKIWKVNGDCIKTINTNLKTLSCLQVLSNNEIIVGTCDGTIEIWNRILDQRTLMLTGHTSTVKSIVYLETGSTILSGSSDKTLKIWNKKNGECVKSIEFKSSVNTILVLKSGEIVAGFNDKSLKILY